MLGTLNPEFDALCAASGRPSIAPEYILRTLLLQGVLAFYSVRSERLLVEQIDYDLLFRRFVGLGMDDAVGNHTVFSEDRDRLLISDVAQRFFAEVNKQAKKFMSGAHRWSIKALTTRFFDLHEDLSLTLDVLDPTLAAVFDRVHRFKGSIF